MKSFRIADADAISHDNVKAAILKPSKGKRNRADVARVLSDIEKSIETIVQYEQDLLSGKETLKAHEPCIINERGPHKQREILKPDYMPEQIIHHIAVNAIKEAVLSGMYVYVLGSVPGRGAHLGKRVIEKWIRTDEKNTRIVGKMDIHHFFQSVDHEILRAWIRKKIRQGEIRNLCEILIDACEEGLPLGYYTSQWFANFLLQPLDHYIKEELHIKYMTRYMDDIVIFGSSKKEIHSAVRAIENYLMGNLNLQMKDNWQVFRLEYEAKEAAIMAGSLRELILMQNELESKKIKYKCKMHGKKRKIFIAEQVYTRKKPEIDALIAKYHGTMQIETMLHGRPLDYMGFEFHRNKTIIRESIMLRATRKAAQISKQEKVCWKDAASLLSYIGWFSATDTYNTFEERIKPKVSVKTMRKIVSKHQRRLNNADHMERGNRNPAQSTGRA